MERVLASDTWSRLLKPTPKPLNFCALATEAAHSIISTKRFILYRIVYQISAIKIKQRYKNRLNNNIKMDCNGDNTVLKLNGILARLFCRRNFLRTVELVVQNAYGNINNR